MPNVDLILDGEIIKDFFSLFYTLKFLFFQ